MEMNGSKVDCDDHITTTAKDLEKLWFTLNNKGIYAGNKVFSPDAALILRKLYIFYN